VTVRAAEDSAEWLEAEEVIADALSNVPVTHVFDAAPEIMRALEAAGFVVTKQAP
jgi:hypothetical protein